MTGGHGRRTGQAFITESGATYSQLASSVYTRHDVDAGMYAYVCVYVCAGVQGPPKLTAAGLN